MGDTIDIVWEGLSACNRLTVKTLFLSSDRKGMACRPRVFSPFFPSEEGRPPAGTLCAGGDGFFFFSVEKKRGGQRLRIHPPVGIEIEIETTAAGDPRVFPFVGDLQGRRLSFS